MERYERGFYFPEKLLEICIPSKSGHIAYHIESKSEKTYMIAKVSPYNDIWGAQWLSGRGLDSRRRGHEFEPHRRHCVVVLEQDTFILAYNWFNPGRSAPV